MAHNKDMLNMNGMQNNEIRLIEEVLRFLKMSETSVIRYMVSRA